MQNGSAKPGQPPSQAPATPPPADGAKPASEAAESNGRMVRNAGLVGALTILSRLLGLYRFRLLAGIFGASGVADAFNFAFVFPNLTRRLFGEGLLTSAFVPVFAGRLASDQREAANKTGSVLLCRMFYWLSFGCLAVIALAEAARWMWPSITSEDLLLIRLFQWMLPYLVFINVAAVLMGVLNSLGHFFMPAFAPVILNVAMIAALLWALPYFGNTPQEQIWAVAYAVLIGGILQMLVQIPPALARGFSFKPAMDTKDPGYQEVMDNFKPVVLLVAVFQFNVMIDNIIAQAFIPGDGPVTYLNMGTSVYQLPWSIFSLALGTVALPALAKYWAQKKTNEYTGTLLSALRLSIFLAVPCTVGLVLLSEDLVRLLYGTGRFLENDGEPVRRTAGVVMFSSMGLVFFSLNAILARALYATKDMLTPTTTSAKSVAINLALNLLFVLGLKWNESGIALASTLSAAWQTWMLSSAIRAKLNADGKKSDSGVKFVALYAGMLMISTAAGIAAYRWAAAKKDWEGFLPFFAGAIGALLPMYLMGRQYFIWRLKDKPIEKDFTLYRYGVRDEHWPDDLKFQYSIYSTTMASAVMGFLVWAVRDSLPPEGSFISVLQRALVPVVIGVAVYMTASSGWLSREYDELWAALGSKLKRK